MAKKKIERVPEDQLPVEVEKESEKLADVATASELDEAQLDAAASEEETDTDQVVPAEIAAIHADTVVAREVTEGKPSIVDTAAASSAKKKERVRSARYLKASSGVDVEKTYSLSEALSLAKAASYSSFPGSIELHARLTLKKGKTTEGVRGLVQLPHGTGKKIDAVILTEDMIAEIAKTKQSKHDILISPKALMPKVAAIAKILGPLGKMPSPKVGTVSDNPEETLAAIQSGRVEYRSDSSGNVHLTIGKVAWEDKQLLENAEVILHALPKNQLQSLTLSATMGLGIRVDVSTIK